MSVYYGERKCEAIYASGKNKGNSCRNKAYYQEKSKYLCGVHSDKRLRKELPKDPNKSKKKQQQIEDNLNEAKIAAKKNKKRGFLGDVITTKMRMMKEIEYEPGYLPVFPNYRHANRKDGLGMASLSPMNLGPVKHGQPDIPIAKNIENFHQGSKCFPSELDKNNYPSDYYYENRDNMYTDPIGHRHKIDINGKVIGKGNIPEFFVWTYVDKKGNVKEKYLDYIQSRQFYCNFYERLAKKTDEYDNLLGLIDDGYNIQIVGYDAYYIDLKRDKRDIEEILEEKYLDPSRPFGHEMVLYTMLMIEDKRNYPWRIHKSENF